ncbi:hypothetical protein CDL15_Pgr006136 [Punica granatum]|uniref:Myb-like domain-containing protein n=1 Tax=Punica granatum TaxID=22663 RepID=A0A218VTI5_PUNGR|nr:hypothetical protein CDL15_Pgr006136 [Punica granatum]PKI68010.1 hypothetical protein CRG98_011606 [Punica granatum]
MGKKSEERKRKKHGITDQDRGACPAENSDANRGEDVVELSGHERKKRKRKHEKSSIDNGLDSAGNASENGKGAVDDESKSERRKKRKMELNADREAELERPRKEKKKIRKETEARAEPDVDPLKLEDSQNEATTERYEKETSAHEDNGYVRSGLEGVKSKKKKKKHKQNLGDSDWVGVGEGQVIMKKGKKKKEESKHGVDEDTTNQLDSGIGNNKKEEEEKRKKKKKEKQEEEEEEEEKKKKEKKEKQKEEKEKKNKKKKEEEKGKKDKLVKGSSRKVRFADEVEIFPSLDSPSEGNVKEKDQLVRGKRFSPEEDELVKKAVYKYIEDHGLGENGLDMILRCKGHAETRHCWKEIGAALPWRPFTSVYYRAHILFERSETRSWTQEEYELIKKYHEEHGSDWRTLADAMSKHRIHVKDTWRRIKLLNKKNGQWTQEEYQSLFELVNKDLQMKAMEEKVWKHGMLKDNICWEAISQKLSTRTNATCCQKWYDQLTSPMVAEKIWADADDYRLLDALVALDACSMEDVDWDCLIENRSGEVCRRRWVQMVRHIGEYQTESFAEQVEILSKRYCPDLLEAREACDKKRLED